MIVLACVLALLILAFAASLPIVRVSSKDDWESAHDAVDNMKVGWNLGNTLDVPKTKDDREIPAAEYETLWGNPVTTREMIKTVKAAGFGVVRVPITWDPHVDDAGNIDEAWMDRVEEVVNYVLDEGMYCIINVHHNTGGFGWLRASYADWDEMSERFRRIWEQISERFNGYGEKLLFEGYNEIRNEEGVWSQPGDGSYKAANDLNQIFVDTVRVGGGNNTKRNLVINTYAANCAPLEFMNMKIPSDVGKGHLVLQVHTYFPMAFTAYRADGVTLTDRFSLGHKLALDCEFWYLGVCQNLMKMPLIVGEFANTWKNNPEDSCSYVKAVTDNADLHGILCIYWDDGGNYQLLNRETLEWERDEYVNYLTGQEADSE